MGEAARDLSRSDDRLLAAARAGDADAFRMLVQPHHRELHLHCYRMLGSLHDAEDLTQETLLRAWRALPTFEDRSGVRAWLYRIATNACLDALRRRARRILPTEHLPAADPEQPPHPMVTDPIWLDPYPDALLDELADPAASYARRESVELAFLAAIQLLPPRQRAVLLLRDVLGWSASETAELLGATVASVNSALQRARAALRERRGTGSAPVPIGAPTREERRLLDRYVRAFQEADVPALLELLREDAVMTMPPDPTWFLGSGAIGTFLSRWVFPLRRPLRLVPTRANRQPAFAIYERGEDGRSHALSLQVIELAGGRIGSITGFVRVDLFPHFGLPQTVEDLPE